MLNSLFALDFRLRHRTMSAMSRRSLTITVWSLLGLLVLATAVFRINDFDTWFHLKTGE